MAYIETHQALLNHRKTLRLSRLLGIDRWGIAGRLMALWSWALDNAQEGIIAEEDSDILADIMGWDGEPVTLCHALVSAGFLDKHANHYAIHDWMDYAGRLIEKRKSDAERKRLARANTGHTSPVQRTSSGHPADGAGTVPYRTLPNHPDTDSFVAADADDAASDDSPQADMTSEQKTPTGKRTAPPATSPASRAAKSPTFAPDSEPFQLATYLRDAILAHKPDAKVPRDTKGLQSWAIVTDKILRLDGRDVAKVRTVIDWAMRDPFWSSNILSPGSLRDQFDRLELAMARKASNGNGNGYHGTNSGPRNKPHAAKTIDEYNREMDEELERLGYGK